MQIILSDKDISEFMEIFLKSKTLRRLLHEKLQVADENGAEDSSGEEKLIIINTDKIESRKKRGRPKKTNLKNSDLITIENENIELEI